MRFSFWLPSNESWPETRGRAERLANDGWQGLWLSDMLLPRQPSDVDLLEVWSTLGALAACVGDVRLGSLVSSNTYRNPTVLAKIAATVERISEGRLTLGLGSGWRPRDHEAFGVVLPERDTRMEMFSEACEILRGLLDGHTVSFNGSHYQAHDLRLNPTPTSKIPLLLGTRNAQLVAQFADQWHLFETANKVAERSAELARMCESVDRDPTAISIVASPMLLIASNPSLIRRIRSAPAGDQVRIGSASSIIDCVGEYSDAGVGEIALPSMGIGQAELDAVSEFAEAVIPEFPDGAA